MNYKVIAQRMQQRRNELGLTLSSVAEQVGVAASTIQRYEQGQFPRVKQPVVEKIANVLGVSVKWLFGYTNDPNEVDVYISLSMPQQLRLYEVLQQSMKAKNLMQPDVAYSAGVSNSFFSRLEQGNCSKIYSLDLRNLFSVLELCDMDAHFVATGGEDHLTSPSGFFTLDRLISESSLENGKPVTFSDELSEDQQLLIRKLSSMTPEELEKKLPAIRAVLDL